VSLLPQRNPGASGISDVPASLAQPAAEELEEEEEEEWPAEELWPADSMPAQTTEPVPWGQPAAQEPDVDRTGEAERAPTDTSAFFASRAQAVSNGVPAQEPVTEPPPQAPPPPEQPAAAEFLPPEPSRHAVHELSPTAGADDAIYQRMLSEWLIDPTEIAKSEDLNWESVWDHGWSAAAAAEDAPVTEHTDEGLPVREPGARLVPGTVVSAGPEAASNGGHRFNGGAHRSDDSDDEVASAAEFDTGERPIPSRDPDAVRASISNHFGGVHAGRSHAQDIRGTDKE
jgi:hypothetical protein